MSINNSPGTPLDVTDSITDNIAYRPVYKHWFYKKSASDIKPTWTPFSMSDSLILDDSIGTPSEQAVSTNGGRFDVDIPKRIRVPIFWSGEPDEVRRCSWFYKGADSKMAPYEEDVAEMLEAEYRDASNTGEWHRKLPLATGETVVFHGPSVMVHFLHAQSPEGWTNTSVPVSVCS